MPLIFYRCSLCKREFSKEKEAAECERSHAKVKRARAVQYTIGAYPYIVEVSFDDGARKTYLLEEMSGTLL